MRDLHWYAARKRARVPIRHPLAAAVTAHSHTRRRIAENTRRPHPFSLLHSASFDFGLIGSMTSMPRVGPEELVNISVAIASAVPSQ